MRRARVLLLGALASTLAFAVFAETSRVEVCRVVAGSDGSGVCTVENTSAMSDDEFREFVQSDLDLSEGASLGEVTREKQFVRATFTATSGLEVVGTLPTTDRAGGWWAPAAGLGLAAAGLGIGVALSDDDSDGEEGGLPTNLESAAADQTPPGQVKTPKPTHTPKPKKTKKPKDPTPTPEPPGSGLE